MSRIAAIRAAAMGAAASDDVDETTPEDTTDRDAAPPVKSKRKDKSMNDEEMKAALDAARKEGQAAGFKAANDRVRVVMASDHYAGREALAANLLNQEAMSAEAIVSALADAPKAAQSTGLSDEQRQAAEDAGREEMRQALGETPNSDIDGQNGGKPDAKAEEGRKAKAGWKKAAAKINALNGFRD